MDDVRNYDTYINIRTIVTELSILFIPLLSWNAWNWNLIYVAYYFRFSQRWRVVFWRSRLRHSLAWYVFTSVTWKRIAATSHPKMETIIVFLKTLPNICQITRHHIPEDRNKISVNMTRVIGRETYYCRVHDFVMLFSLWKPAQKHVSRDNWWGNNLCLSKRLHSPWP
jgi:hypothetical protein